jgi:drug/metabolite transporter (DMT)-like permease
MPKSTARVYSELTAVSAIWGGVFLVVKFALEQMGPMKMALTRYVLASLMLFPFVALREKGRLLPRRENWFVVAVTGVQAFIYQFCFFHGMKLTSVINTSLIIAANPIMTAVLAGIFQRERLHPVQKLGIGLSFAGELFVLSQGSLENLLRLQFNKGDLLLLVAITSWAINSLLLRKYSGKISPLRLSAWSCAIAAVFFVPLGWSESPVGLPMHWTLPLIAALFYIVALSTALSNVWWYGGVMELGPSRSAIFSNLCPVFTLLFMLLLGKSVEPNQWIGAVLVVAGIYLTTRKWDVPPLPTEA